MTTMRIITVITIILTIAGRIRVYFECLTGFRTFKDPPLRKPEIS